MKWKRNNEKAAHKYSYFKMKLSYKLQYEYHEHKTVIAVIFCPIHSWYIVIEGFFSFLLFKKKKLRKIKLLRKYENSL